MAPVGLATAAQRHKKQNIVGPPGKLRLAPALAIAPAQSTAPRAVPRADIASKSSRNPLPITVSFALIALGLLALVLGGLYMAWRSGHRSGLFGAVLARGLAVPLALLRF